MIVKICGITTLVDARMALDAGADWIGLNLVSGPRRLELPSVLTILNGLSDRSSVVGLVALHDGVPEDSIAAALRDHGVRRLQLYGQVTPQALDSLQLAGFETIFVQPVVDEHSLEALEAFLAMCGEGRPEYVLLDSAVETSYLGPTRADPSLHRSRAMELKGVGPAAGGTGRQANWNAIEKARSHGRFAHWPPIILAGGLTPDNVAEAISRITPTGVDVSSGVESAPGRKDQRKIGAFLTAVRGHVTE